MEAEIQGYLWELNVIRKQIRDAVHDLDNDAANWRPVTDDSNSICYFVPFDRFLELLGSTNDRRRNRRPE